MKILKQFLMKKRNIEKKYQNDDSQRSDTEKINVIEEDRNLDINEVNKRNKIIITV